MDASHGSCERHMDLRLRAHLQVIYPAEGVTCSSICSSAGETNNSQYNHVITLCYNPSKQNQKTPTKVGLAVKMV